MKEQLVEAQKGLKLGSPLEFDTFTSAVIDRAAFSKITGYLQHAKNSSNLKVVAGGGSDDSQGFFVQPTILETSDPHDRIMKEEIFGPVYTAYVYPDNEVDKCLALARDTAPFALTASVFARDENFLKSACDRLEERVFLAPTTRPGGPHYLLRFSSAQTIKETKVPLTDIKYPYMMGS
ncbi:hypothetical protein MTO96_046679 [Rhipicephalus appendiculatus]